MKYYYILYDGKLHRSKVKENGYTEPFDFDVTTIPVGERYWMIMSNNPNMTVEEVEAQPSKMLTKQTKKRAAPRKGASQLNTGGRYEILLHLA